MGRKPLTTMFACRRNNSEIFIYIAVGLVWDSVPGDNRWYLCPGLQPTDDFLATLLVLNENPRPDLVLPVVIPES